MKFKALGIASAITAFSAAAPAAAVTYVIPLGSAGSSMTSFGPIQPGSGRFSDNFLFNVPTSGRVTVTIQSMQDPDDRARTNVNFVSNGVRFNGVVVPVISNGVMELRTLVNAVTGSGISELVVRGSAGALGTYTGSLTFSVPEPATWALFILGFGVIGSGMRVRRSRVNFATA